MSVYVTDTHPLVWYAAGTRQRLSKRVLEAFHAAERAEALIYVPAFVLWEVAMLLKKGRIALREDFGVWAERLTAHRGFELALFNAQVAAEAYNYPLADPFDGVIAATAKVMDLPLITKDAEIAGSGFVDVCW